MKKIGNFIHYDNEKDKLIIDSSEIVCSHLYKKYGKNAMKLIDKRLLKFITIMMSSVFAGRYLLINNYKNTDALQIDNQFPVSEERGLHCNLCRSNLLSSNTNRLYVNRRLLGLGIDFDIYDYDEDKDKMIKVPVDEVFEDIANLVSKQEFNYQIDKHPNYISLEFVPEIEEEEDDYGELMLERYGVPGLPPLFHSYTYDEYNKLKEKSPDLVVDYGEYESEHSSISIESEESDEFTMMTPQEIASMPLEMIDGIYMLMRYNPGATEEQLKHRLRFIATDLKCNPNWIMAVISSESGGDPAIWNGNVAVGLIQFTRVACTALKTNQAHIESLTAYQQLEWVYKYYKNALKGFIPRNPGDLYVATFAPAYLGREMMRPIYSYPSKAYTQNSGLDPDGKGYITSWDLTRRIARKAKEFNIRI